MEVLNATENLVQPYLNADLYRAHNNAETRAPCIDFIDIHSDGTTLVGCSDLTGRYWNGAVRIADSINDVKLTVTLGPQDKGSKQCTIDLNSGVTGGCFLRSSNKIAVSEDSGCISIWDKTQESAWSAPWNLVNSACDHDDAIMSTDKFASEDKIVTGSADGCIKIWSVDELIAIQNYRAAHRSIIYEVAVKPASDKVFASASMDCNFALWDVASNAQVKAFKATNAGVRAICWIKEELVALGDEGGCLTVLDLRQPDQILCSINLPSAVHRISYSKKHDLIAVCADNRTVTAFQLLGGKTLQKVYEDVSHKDLVRGLAWDSNTPQLLHSGSWDGSIVSHSIQNT